MRFGNIDEYREDAIRAAKDFRYWEIVPNVISLLKAAVDDLAIADIMRACRKADTRLV